MFLLPSLAASSGFRAFFANLPALRASLKRLLEQVPGLYQQDTKARSLSQSKGTLCNDKMIWGVWVELPSCQGTSASTLYAGASQMFRECHVENVGFGKGHDFLKPAMLVAALL